jgi:nucleotide-binding universal stress UspA family protein
VNEKLASPRIVVGVDGSPASERALRWAAAEAVRRSAALEVVHAWTTPYPLNPPDYFVDPAPFEARGAEILHRMMTSLAGRDVPGGMRPVLVRDRAAQALLEAADGAQLLVVGSRGRGGFSGLLLGSVSQDCVQRAPCPVAVIPPAWAGESHGRVVVGVDGSEPSSGALRWAAEAAALREAELDAVNAFDALQVVMPMGLAAAGADRELLAKASDDLLQEMTKAATDGTGPRPRSVELISMRAGPARALLDAALGADLLVVGSRGRGGVRGLLLGSVSQQCVHHAPCPIVVVPSRGIRHSATEPPPSRRRSSNEPPNQRARVARLSSPRPPVRVPSAGGPIPSSSTVSVT